MGQEGRSENRRIAEFYRIEAAGDPSVDHEGQRVSVPITRMGKTVIRDDVHRRFLKVLSRANAKETLGEAFRLRDDREEERFLERAVSVATTESSWGYDQ